MALGGSLEHISVPLLDILQHIPLPPTRKAHRVLGPSLLILGHQARDLGLAEHRTQQAAVVDAEPPVAVLAAKELVALRALPPATIGPAGLSEVSANQALVVSVEHSRHPMGI